MFEVAYECNVRNGGIDLLHNDKHMCTHPQSSTQCVHHFINGGGGGGGGGEEKKKTVVSSTENQKGINAAERCSVENQKGTNTIDCVQG